MAQQIVQFGLARAETAAYQLIQKGVSVQRIDGYCNGANSWLMLFDLTAAPGANVVPKKALQVFGNDGFSYTFSGQDELLFQNGVYVALSTSEVNYVADASGTKISGDVTLNDFDLDVPNEAALTVVGDLTSNVDSVQVWTEAAAASRKLVRLSVVNATAAIAYLMLFAKDAAAANGDVPIAVLPLANSAAVQVKSFGPRGRDFRAIDSTAARTERRGLTAYFSTTGDVLTQTVGVANRLLAWYRAS